MKAIRLKIEHLFDPVGVDFSAPRLFWNCEGGRKQRTRSMSLSHAASCMRRQSCSRR